MRRLQNAVVAGGHELPHRRVRQQIAGQLLDRELVERQIVVERLDDIIAVRRDAMLLVAVVADRVGETAPGRTTTWPSARRTPATPAACRQAARRHRAGCRAGTHRPRRAWAANPVRSKYNRRTSVARSASAEGAMPRACIFASRNRSISFRGQSRRRVSPTLASRPPRRTRHLPAPPAAPAECTPNAAHTSPPHRSTSAAARLAAA